MRDFKTGADEALLLLGRLDGRLINSPAADLWLARARLKGAALLAGSASVPITIGELEDWICGRRPPPRHSEGLNDPLSVAALMHFALSADNGNDPVALATLNMSRSLLDDRKEAELWAPEDLVRFGPAWRAVQAALEAPYAAKGVMAVAERLITAKAQLEAPVTAGQLLTTADGRQFRLDPRRSDLGWVVACHIPMALKVCGLAMRHLPSFVDLGRFPGEDAGAMAQQLVAMIARQAADGLHELDRLERRGARLPEELRVTKRSKAPLLMRLELAYPGLSRPAAARLLGISHQGVTKLMAQIAAARS